LYIFVFEKRERIRGALRVGEESAKLAPADFGGMLRRRTRRPHRLHTSFSALAGSQNQREFAVFIFTFVDWKTEWNLLSLIERNKFRVI